MRDSAFGAFCNLAFEDIARDNMAAIRKAHDCDKCVDVGHVPMCGQRSWGTDRPKPPPGQTLAEEDLYTITQPRE